MTFKDITGMRFGRLLVIERGLNDKRYKGTTPTRFWCMCDCGNKKLISSSNLQKGITNSCGCLAKERSSARLIAKAVDPDMAVALAFYRSYKGNAHNRNNMLFDLSLEQAVNMGMQNCTYCGSEPSRLIKVHARLKTPQGSLRLNGIDRVDNSLGYTVDNCVSCCTICNQAKHTLSKEEWISWLNRIVNFRGTKRAAA